MHLILFASTIDIVRGQASSVQDAEALINGLKGSNIAIRENNEGALVKMGEAAIPALRAALFGEDDGLALQSISILAEIGSASITSLTQVLSDESLRFNFARNKAAADGLRRIGPSAVPLMVEACIGDNVFRWNTLFIMDAVREIGPPAISGLNKVVEESVNPASRYLAAILLGEMKDEAAVPGLIQLLKDEYRQVRSSAVIALKKLRSKGRTAVPALIHAIEKKQDIDGLKEAEELKWEPPFNFRAEAVEALGKIAPKDETTFEALIKAANDYDPAVRSQVAIALGKIRSKAEIVPILIEKLKDDIGSVRSSAAAGLGQIGPEAKSAVFNLIEALRDVDGRVRAEAVEALGKIAPKDETTFEALIKTANDHDPAVRSQVAIALGRMLLETQTVVPILKKTLKDSNGNVRRAAASALGQIGREAKQATLDLSEALKDVDGRVREEAIKALGKIGPSAKAGISPLMDIIKTKPGEEQKQAANALQSIGSAAIPYLIEALSEKDAAIRQNVARALGGIRPLTKQAILVLVGSLNDVDPTVRKVVASSLGKIEPKAYEAVDALSNALADENQFVRMEAAMALGQIGQGTQIAVPSLIAALKDENTGVRQNATTALGKIGQNKQEVINALIAALKDEDTGVRQNAISAISKLGPRARIAFPSLLETLKESETGTDLQGSIADALVDIAVVIQDSRQTESIPELQLVHQALSEHPDLATVRYPQHEHARALRRTIEHLELMWWKQMNRKVLGWGNEHPMISSVGIVYIIWIFVCSVLLWLRPLTLLRINDFLRPFEVKLPDSLLGIRLSLRYLIFVGFLNYNLRVLDAWVGETSGTVRKRFTEKSTVRHRDVHIPIPVHLDDEVVSDLRGENLRPIFEKSIGYLLIWGEGGSGKTSLACQIAKCAMAEELERRISNHLMLPVLIEEELDFPVPEGEDKLTQSIRRNLQVLTDTPEAIPGELLEHLLRSQRVLVIVDHLSEMSEITRAEINPNSPVFQANALIVTSRLQENLGGLTPTIVSPLRIAGNNLSSFMEAYLMRRQKRVLFNDAEFFDACGKLTEMVGEREITVLFAKLYAEQMIVVKEEVATVGLPDNIPDLMLSYLNEINRGVTEGKLADNIVHRLAKITAWECLKHSYLPASAKIDDVLTAIDGDNAKTNLNYLEERLNLIATAQPGQEHIRFLLDPLAEYLAGIYLVDTYMGDEQMWREFLVNIEGMPGSLDGIKGFLLAVRDSCLKKENEATLPNFLIKELNNLTGLN